MRFLILTSIFIFSLWGASASYAGAKNFTLDKIAPDQNAVGFAEVKSKADEMLAEAQLVATTGHTDVQSELIKILNKKLQLDVKAYISPDGMVRILDGHHKVLAALQLMKEENISMDRVKLSAKIEKDFSSKNWEAYAKYRERHDPTYIPGHLRTILKKKQIVAFYKNLPATFDTIKNSPIRSSVGHIFEELSLKGTDFDPFIQFRVCEMLAADDISVNEGEEFSEHSLAAIRSAIFEGGESNKIYQMIVHSALPGKSETVKLAMSSAHGLSLATTKMGESAGSDLGGAAPVICADNFASLERLTAKLPKLNFPTDARLFKTLIDSSKETFLKKLDVERLRDVLKTLESGAKLSAKDQLFLKESRKSSLIFRSAVKLLGAKEEREATGPFRSFVKKLGQLNDKIEDWGFKGKAAKSLREDAGELRQLLKKDILAVDISAKTPEEFLQTQREYLGWMKTSLEKDSMTVEEYHDLRKAVRDYRGLTELLYRHSPSPGKKELLDMLGGLSRRMGKIKDGLLSGDMPAASLLGRQTRVDPESRAQIEKFLEMMKE